jgi:hypothetical protein
MSVVRTFFKQLNLKNIFDWKEQAMNRETFINKIQALRLPKIDLAALAGQKPPKISEYVRGEKLPYEVTNKIEAAILAVEQIQTVLAPHRLDTSNAENFWALYAAMKADGYFEARKNFDIEMAQEAVQS